MPISKPEKDATEPKVVSEEEYRKTMESEIRTQIEAEMAVVQDAKTVKEKEGQVRAAERKKKTT